MNKFKIITALFLLSTCAQAMDTSTPWFRIDEKKGRFEVPFKSYRNTESGKTIMLLSMCHIGMKAYYEKVNELITAKAVIYELHKSDWAAIGRERQEIEQLDEIYQKRFKLSTMNEYSFVAPSS